MTTTFSYLWIFQLFWKTSVNAYIGIFDIFNWLHFYIAFYVDMFKNYLALTFLKEKYWCNIFYVYLSPFKKIYCLDNDLQVHACFKILPLSWFWFASINANNTYVCRHYLITNCNYLNTNYEIIKFSEGEQKVIA